LNGAKAEGLRTGENPALWRGHLDQVLTKRKKSEVQHHPALPYEQMPAFWQSLAAETSDAARMLRWIILAACRFNEAHDIDIDDEVKGDTWTIPAVRMKAEREHKVPLTDAALAQLPFRPEILGRKKVFIPNPIFRERSFRAISRASHEKPSNEWLLRANSCPWQLSNFVFIPEMILKSGRFNVPPVPRATRAITPTWRRR
jgi:integrase